MSRKLLITLLISIAAHMAAVVALDWQEVEPKTISMGSVKAPVSLSFSTVSQPKPEPVVEKPTQEPEPKQKPKPPEIKKPEPKPVVKAKPVLKKPKLKPQAKPEAVVEKKPVPPKPTPEEKKEARPEPRSELQPEPAVERMALKESKVEGISDEPVMVFEPAIRNWKAPRYPKIARRRNQQGVVMLDVIVDEKGNPETIEILESSGFSSLDEAAIVSVERWAFEPQQRNNLFVKSRVHIPVAFRLN